MISLIEAAKNLLEAVDKHAIHHEHGCTYMDGPREDLRLAINNQDDCWPKLERPASLHDNGGGTFGRGVSARLLVEAAYRHHENTMADRAKTPEQRQDDEANRRALWDMIHGTPQSPDYQGEESGNVHVLPVVTTHDIPADRILRAALKAGMSKVVILGYDADDTEYFASSVADGGTVLWLMERCKKKLIDID